MPYSSRSSYSSRSRSPYYRRSLSRSRSRSRSLSPDAENPGNNLYVTGLSSRATKRDVEKHFSREGKVVDVHLVLDPWTKESRGFGFVTMASVEDANCCLKYLDRSVLEGRVITVEKARRGGQEGKGQNSYSREVPWAEKCLCCFDDVCFNTYCPFFKTERRRSPSYSPYRRGRYDSPGYSSDMNYLRRSYSRSRSSCDPRDRSPGVRRRQRSYSPADSRSRSPRGRSVSPYYRRRRRSCSATPRRYSRRHYSRSISPMCRRRSRRSYSRSVSLPRGRSYSRSTSPIRQRRSRRSYSPSYSPIPRRSGERSRSSKRGRRHSRESYSHSRSRGLSSHSRSISGSRSPWN